MVGFVDDVLGITGVAVGGQLFLALFVAMLLFFIVVRFAGEGAAFSVLGVLLIVVGRAMSFDVMSYIGIFIVALVVFRFFMELFVRW